MPYNFSVRICSQNFRRRRQRRTAAPQAGCGMLGVLPMTLCPWHSFITPGGRHENELHAEPPDMMEASVWLTSENGPAPCEQGRFVLIIMERTAVTPPKNPEMRPPAPEDIARKSPKDESYRFDRAVRRCCRRSAGARSSDAAAGKPASGLNAPVR